MGQITYKGMTVCSPTTGAAGGALTDNFRELSDRIGPSNYTATSAPAANHDISQGYYVGSRWIDTVNQIEYVCLDNTLGSAVWTPTSNLAIIDWQESVIDFYDPSGGLPVGPSIGDRYISDATANGWTENYIYEYNGSTWEETIINEGTAAWVEDQDALYLFNGTTWVIFGNTVTHNNTSGLQGGASSQYYHLNSSDYNALTDVNAQLTDLHTDGNPTFNDITINGMVFETGSHVVSDADYTITDNDGIRHLYISTGAADRTVLLPTLADNIGRIITIEKTDYNTLSSLLIDGEGGETINGKTTAYLTCQGDSLTLRGKSDEWKIVSDNKGCIKVYGTIGGSERDVIFIGPNAGKSWTLASGLSDLVFLGTNAGENNTGDSVVAVGEDCGENNTGDNCVMAGEDAGRNNDGDNCVLLGRDAGWNNSGNYLVAVGRQSGRDNTSRYVNAIGSGGVGFNNDGDYNDFMGYEAAEGSSGNTNYTASTIAFVATSPPTITDSASQFIIEGFAPGDVIEITGGVNDGVRFTINSVVAGTITLESRDAVNFTAEAAGASRTITEGGQQTGDENVAIGRAAFKYGNASNCVSLGSHAGYSNWEDDRLFIHSSTSDVGEEALITGHFSELWTKFNGQVGIGSYPNTAQFEIADDADDPPMNITERSSAPTTPSANDIYLDDGTNTASGNPGWRRYTGAAWEDISAGGGSATLGIRIGLEELVNADYANAYHEITYTGVNVTGIDVWDTIAKVTKLFTRTITYTGSNITQIQTVDNINTATLTETFTYDGSGNVLTITKAVT